MGLSIVIPAYNEGPLIDECLHSVAAQTHRGDVEVIVVANGCSDDTTERVRRRGHRLAPAGYQLILIEREEPSKPSALNAGDERASFSHRVYLDADVRLSESALACVASAFDRGVLFCAPVLVSESRGRLSEDYAQVWCRLPYVADDVVGAGFYAVHARGRQRWNMFPNIVADDKFARLHFVRHERQVLTDSQFIVCMPSGLRDLVRVRSRWIRANRQLRRRFPSVAASEPRRLAGIPTFPLLYPRLWRHLPGFIFIYACAEARSWSTEQTDGQLGPWERSEEARAGRAAERLKAARMESRHVVDLECGRSGVNPMPRRHA